MKCDTARNSPGLAPPPSVALPFMIRLPQRLVERLHRVFAAAHRVRVMAQRHHRALVPSELRREPHLDPLRLEDRDD